MRRVTRRLILGKWHLGHSRKEYWPNSRGFDYAYGHVNGELDYFTHVRDGGWIGTRTAWR